jgi:hypothetical protein
MWHANHAPGLSQFKRGKQKNLGILLYFCNMLEPIVSIWQFQIFFPQSVDFEKIFCSSSTGFFLLLLSSGQNFTPKKSLHTISWPESYLMLQ